MKRILLQGDSITDSGRYKENPDSVGNGYACLVAAEIGAKYPYQYKVINRGISGNRVIDLLARIKGDFIKLKPDIISILIGVNDVWAEIDQKNGVDAARFEHYYDLLIQQLLEELPDVKIMIMEPYVCHGTFTNNRDEEQDRWEYFYSQVRLRAAAAKRIAEKYKMPFVPLQETLEKAVADAPQEDYWLQDGVHPTPAGHELIAKAWMQAFQTVK